MRRPVTHSLVQALRGVPAFDFFDEQALVRVVGVSANLRWPAGASVFEKDSESEALYIVLSGRVRIVDPAGDGEAEVAQLGPGEFFGELSLMLQTAHSKRAVAVEETELMVLPKASFIELLGENPELSERFRGTAQQRLGGEVSELT